MTKTARDFINAIIILLFCGGAYYGALMIPQRGLGKTEADLFPKIMIAIVAFLGLCLLVQSLIRMKNENGFKINISFRTLYKDNKKVIWTFLIFAAYVFALNILDYFVSSILFLMSLYMLIAEKRQKIWIVLLGVIVFTAILYIIFQQALSVFLPKGLFF